MGIRSGILGGFRVLAFATVAICMTGTSRADTAADVASTWLDYIERLPKPQTVTDYLSPRTALEFPVAPGNGAITAQNPPVFHWRYDAVDTTYEVELIGQDGTRLHRLTPYNHMMLDAPLEKGNWRWRARAWPGGQPAEAWGAWREFSIHPKAHVFVAPSVSEAWDRAVNNRGPRSLPPKEEFKLLRRGLRQGDRKKVFNSVRRTVEDKWVGDELTKEPPVATFEVEDFYERIRVARFIAGEVNRATVRLSTIIYTYWLTRDEPSLKESWRRAANLLSWDPDHSTGLRSSDLSNLRISLTLALTYDITKKWLDDEQKAELLAMIEYRTQAAFDRYIVDRRRQLEVKPYNSHGFRQAGAITAISILLARDSSRAKNWFFRTYPIYLATNNPWGGDDGGFGNGVNYGVWDAMNSMQYWDVMRNAIGVDPVNMSWPQQAGIFFSYLIPPGTPNSAFGDGGEYERADVWSLLAQMYLQRVNTPISRRFAAQWSDVENRDEYFVHLYGPLYEPAKPFEPADHVELPNTAVFPSIGWVAMHSELDDPDRYSILFKSSPYGSFNHSHGDQNSFIINGRKQSLAIDSGYYDTWKSAHHEGWTMQTKAHNAITYDGGTGQPFQDRSASGDLVNFARCGDVDMAVGDATAAYKGELSRAIRTMMYVRPDVALIYDDLASETPRRFEWNLHSWTEIDRVGASGLNISRGEGSACFTVLSAPDFGIGQSNEFPANPDEFFVPDWQPQWHATVSTKEKVNAAEFLVAVDLGCKGNVAEAVTPRPGGGFSLQIGGQKITIDASGGTAEPLGPTRAPPACKVPPLELAVK
ncbi:MAG: DUF4962 domain-containing protein [Minwuia sp.]|nr:DUF4962 domain-containing protein [Minwuia sp.]